MNKGILFFISERKTKLVAVTVMAEDYTLSRHLDIFMREEYIKTTCV